MSPLRPSTRDLFAAAREDAPSRDTHERMWESVASATGIAAGTAAVAGGASTGLKAAVSAKLVAVIGLVAVTGTAIGGIVSLASEDTAPSVAPDTARAGALHARPTRVASARAAGNGARLVSTARALDPAMTARAAEPRARDVEPATASATASSAGTARPNAPSASDLAAEAKIITDARAALVAGDPKRALTLVRSAQRLSTRALQPEALSLEARILHALGRPEEAAATELELRRRYSGHALAR